MAIVCATGMCPPEASGSENQDKVQVQVKSGNRPSSGWLSRIFRRGRRSIRIQRGQIGPWERAGCLD